jgi:hypothetical protein
MIAPPHDWSHNRVFISKKAKRGGSASKWVLFLPTEKRTKNAYYV